MRCTTVDRASTQKVDEAKDSRSNIGSFVLPIHFAGLCWDMCVGK